MRRRILSQTPSSSSCPSGGMNIQQLLSMRIIMRLLGVLTTIAIVVLPVESFHGVSIISSTTSLQQHSARKRRPRVAAPPLYAFYNDFEQDLDNNDDDDDDDDEDAESMMTVSQDWRAFRRNLIQGTSTLLGGTTEAAEAAAASSPAATKLQQQQEQWLLHNKENQDLLKTQCEELANEYRHVWAHTTAMPEVGGLVVRLPLEAEIYRNARHSRTGRKLHEQLTKRANTRAMDSNDESSSTSSSLLPVQTWYTQSQQLIEQGMMDIIGMAGDDGQVDPNELDHDSAELLQLYLDNQETWQEVCLVLSSSSRTTTTLVLNRPMALKLTDNLAQLVLRGAYASASSSSNNKRNKTSVDLINFVLAFGGECAVYVGGPDDQDKPAILLHGIADLAGATEISPGSRIYTGGLEAAVQGILQKKYKPMDFRFFVGRHVYTNDSSNRESEGDDNDDSSFAFTHQQHLSLSLHVHVLLGKYQPIACARSLVLKQCISLPKPLWHEVLELAGDELAEISKLELSKRQKDNNVQVHIVEEDDEEHDIVYLSDVDGLDEEELGKLEDDDDDDDYYNAGD